MASGTTTRSSTASCPLVAGFVDKSTAPPYGKLMLPPGKLSRYYVDPAIPEVPERGLEA